MHWLQWGNRGYRQSGTSSSERSNADRSQVGCMSQRDAAHGGPASDHLMRGRCAWQSTAGQLGLRDRGVPVVIKESRVTAVICMCYKHNIKKCSQLKDLPLFWDFCSAIDTECFIKKMNHNTYQLRLDSVLLASSKFSGFILLGCQTACNDVDLNEVTCSEGTRKWTKFSPFPRWCSTSTDVTLKSPQNCYACFMSHWNKSLAQEEMCQRL